MIAALDATPLTVATGGVSRYTAELARALADEFPDDDYRLVSDQEFAMPSGRLRGGRVRSRRWWSVGLARELARIGADVFHGTDFAVPYLPLRPSVMTIHDLSPWRFPAWQPGAERVRRRAPYLAGLGLATAIVTPTEAIKRECIEMFRAAPARVTAVPLAAAAHFRPTPRRAGARPYFLFLGTVEPRKNVPAIVDAWREVRRGREVDLVIAGRRRADAPEMAPEPGMRLLGETPEEDLAGLYSEALACLYPSHYEGFGLPVLEAMQCGAAVFTTHDPAILEVSGGAAVHLDARDPRAWAEAMRAALDGPEWIASLGEAGVRRARDFSWPRTARLTRAVYDEAIRRF